MKRHEFEFAFTGKALGEAAASCQQHHTGRLAHYREEYDAAMAKMKADGVEIVINPEARGGRAAYSSSTQRILGNVSVDVDHKLMERIEVCDSKMKEHERLQAEFGRWVLAFRRQPEETFRLNIDDMNYFWL